MMKTKRYGTFRRLAGIVQAAVILGVPFLEVGGHSALRFDVAELTLHFFGAIIPMNEFFIVLVAIIFITLLTVLLTALFGRIWCGWACPQTVLSDFTSFVERSPGRTLPARAGIYLVVFSVSALVSADLIWYFVSPYDFFRRLSAGQFGSVLWGFWLVLTLIMFLNLSFLRRKFCATVCPYAKLQSVLFDDRTLVIAFDDRRAAECMDCRACARVCPVGVDIRDGLSAACIGCAMCVDTCGEMMRGRRKNALVGYFFGRPGAQASGMRYGVVLMGVATFAFCTFLVYLLATRSPFDVLVLRDFTRPSGTGADGYPFMHYVLALDNRTPGALPLGITAGVPHGTASLQVNPGDVVLGPSENLKVPIRVTVVSGTLSPSEPIEILVHSGDGNARRVVVRSRVPLPGGAP